MTQKQLVSYQANNYIIEKAAFKAKMKAHYKGTFNEAAAMKASPAYDED